jgi:hypothetical protein
MRAREFKNLDSEDRDWEVFDALQKGTKRMDHLEDQVNTVCDDLKNHKEDGAVHRVPKDQEIPEEPLVVRRRKELILTLVTTITLLILAAISEAGGI